MSQRGRRMAAESAKKHPLIVRMRQIRKANKKRLKDVSKCMEEKEFPLDIVKRIENGLQRLPHVIPGTGKSLRDFMAAWLFCVGATEEQRNEIEELVQATIFGELPDS